MALIILSSSEDEDEYTVEKIKAWRYNFLNKTKEFYIKWQNYPESQNTWEPRANLNCPSKVTEFIRSLSRRELQKFRAKNLSELDGVDRHAEFVKCIGADGPDDYNELAKCSTVGSANKDKHKHKFYCLLTFEDSDMAEETTLERFFHYRPEEALEFCEQRLLLRPNTPAPHQPRAPQQ